MTVSAKCQRTRTSALIAAVAALVAGPAICPPAAQAATETPFDYAVTSRATYQDIPDTAITFTAEAGEASYLWARKLSTQNVTKLYAGDNVGNTFAIACRNSAGATVPGESGAYWASNLVPPGETSMSPTLRWLFVAPAAGTYTCLLRITSYSTIVDGGRSVTMRIPAYAELARAVYPRASRWTLQEADSATVSAGTTLTTLGATITPSAVGADKIAVTQDVALSTCVAGSTLCSGGSTANSGSTVRTWIEGQPQTSTGAACGTVLRGTVATSPISNAKHHLSMANTLYLTEAGLDGCARLRVTLKVEVISGNPVKVHSGLVGGMAATHGVVFEYV